MFEDYFADRSPQPGGDADPDNSGFSFLGMSRGFGRMTCLHDQLSCLFKEGVSRLGQLDSALVAHKERDAQILFQVTDLTAQGWLRDVQLLSGFSEVEVFRDGDEISNVT